MKNRTLEEIIRAEQENRHEGGAFGIEACKRSVRFSKEELGEPYAEQLEKFVQRANEDVFFNKTMVLACYELMQEEEAEKAEANAEAETATAEEPKKDAPKVCEGFETAPNFGTGHEILKANTFGHTRNLMRALNAVFGFDFCAPYYVAEVSGKYTVNKIRKAVEAVAPLYDVNRSAFRVVALCSVDHPSYYAGRLYAVEITPDSFDVDHARGVNQSRFSSSNSFDYCYKKAQFDELRKEESARCFVVVQASEYLRIYQGVSRTWRRTDLMKPGERYDLEKVNCFCYAVGGASYIGELEMRTRTASGELIHYKPPRFNRRDAILAENIGEVIDKSGYLLQERRADLQSRAEALRAEKRRRAYEETDNSEKVEQLRAIIGAKRHALAFELERAKTSEEVTGIYKELRNYGNGFASIVADFERFEERTKAKEYPSIEASEKAYNDILARLMA